MVVGIDEVGRGAWAGPLVVGAVVLGEHTIEGLTDSKKLSAKKRQFLAGQIKNQAKGIGLGWISAETIDKYGLTACLKLATQKALAEVGVTYDQIIIDGTFNFLEDPSATTMKQADLLVPSVSAASIVAKVARDYYMATHLHKELPQYDFDKHVGYGTARHAAALQDFGPSDAHRLSFTPVQKAIGVSMSPENRQKVTEVTSGTQAESFAASFLKQKGFCIVDCNWRTKVCEIDIIAQKDDVTYCVEVKYRKNARHGDGLTAITPKKLAQMKFATRIWQQFHNAHEESIQLAVISVSGDPMRIDNFLQLS